MHVSRPHGVVLQCEWTDIFRPRRRAIRPSLEERYESKDDYLANVKAAVQCLIDQRLLLESDLDSQLKQAGERWDWVIKQSSTIPSPHG